MYTPTILEQFLPKFLSAWSSRLFLLGAALLGLAALAMTQLPLLAPFTTPTEPLLPLSQLPLAFTPNAGQRDAAVHFQVNDLGGTVFFTTDAVVLSLPTHEVSGASVVKWRFVDANPAPVITGSERLPGVVNYLVGDDAATWYTNLPTYDGIVYQQLYPGINLRYDGVHGRLKGTYIIAPSVDPGQIRWRHEGVTDVRVAETTGNLLISFTDAAGQPATLIEEAPIAWQEIQGQRVAVDVRYAVGADGSIGFALQQYNPAYPLTIDPTILYSTYLGGSSYEEVERLAVDNAGNVYLVGSTESTNFPTQNAQQGNNRGDRDAFVIKINAAGDALVYSTYLGGSGFDLGTGITVDSDGNAYVLGETDSTNFPTQNALQSSCATFFSVCIGDLFVTKINPAGNGFVYSTYFGGGSIEVTGGIAIDGSNNVYITGGTASDDLPLKNPLQATNKGESDAFVAKLTAGGNELVYSTYLGGSDTDSAFAIAADPAGNAYLTGGTSSTDFPTQTPFQAQFAGEGDLFITKLNATGNALLYSTYLGGGKMDASVDIAVDTSGNSYVVGYTKSSNFPTQNPVQAVFGGEQDAFVTKLNSSGNALVYSSYLGGSNKEEAYAIALNSAGNGYITGMSNSPNFPTANPLQATHQGNGDAFITKLSVGGNTLDFSSYLGGSNTDQGTTIALDGSGNLIVGGVTLSTNFPLQAPIQGSHAGQDDGFLVKISDNSNILLPTATATLTPADPLPKPSDTPTSTATPLPLVTPVPSGNLLGTYKYASHLILEPGKTLTYKIRLHNSGTEETTVTISDPLPAEVTYVEGSVSNGGVYDTSTRTVTWSNISVPSTDDIVLSFDVTAGSVDLAKIVVNTAVIAPSDQTAFKREFPILLVATALDKDIVPPVVQSLTISERDVLTSRDVTLHITASDDVGVKQMYLREWQLVTGPVPHWEVVQSSDWIPFAQTQPWTLGEKSGTHYIGVWVRDESENSSLLDRRALDFASLLLPGASVGELGIVPYLAYYDADQNVTATLAPAANDADLYVWYPGNFGMPNQKSTATGTATDMVSFTTPQAGVYLFLVYGQTATTYDLTITPEGGPQAWPLVRSQASQTEPAPAIVSSAGPMKDNLTTEPVLIWSGLDPLGSTATPIQIFTAYLPIVKQ